jgi:hypothetical protein
MAHRGRIGRHTFRRSLATELVGKGAPVKLTQEIMRHANARNTLELYAQSMARMKRAIEQMAESWSGTDTSIAVGYNNVSSFIVNFGAPSEVRQRGAVMRLQIWLLVKGDSIGRLDSTKRCFATSGAIAGGHGVHYRGERLRFSA